MTLLSRWPGRLLRNPRVVVSVGVFAVAVLLFVVQRGVVMLGHRERLAGLTGGEIATSFLVGLRFDLFAAALLSVPAVVILSLVPASWLTRAWFRWTASGVCAAVLAGATFGAVADFYFFREFDERLNHKALVYLDQPYTYAVIWRQYPVVWAFAATIVALAAVAWAIGRLSFRREPADFGPGGRIAWTLAQAAVLALCIRGTIGPKAINPGPAYFSNSSTLAQITLNPIYTLQSAAASMTYRADDLGDDLKLLPEADALALAAKLIVRPEDLSEHSPANPLLRTTDTHRPRHDHNVVFVVLESLSWHYIGALGGDPTLTPNLSRLIDDGLIMDRCFGVGDRTTRGFSGIVGAFPDLPGRSVTTRTQALGDFFTLGHVLRARGYQTAFVYAGQPMYDHRQSFLRSNGFNKMVFEDQFDTKTFRTDLGWCDEDLFNEAVRQCDQMSHEGKPFLATMLTLSFHRPFQIPAGKIPDAHETTAVNRRFVDQRQALRYTDWAIGRFMDRAKAAPWFKDTIFVFAADHTGGYLDSPFDFSTNRVPFLMYNPGLLGPAKRVSAVCSQTDIIPTLMGVLGGQYEQTAFGSDVLSRPADAGQALMQREGELGFIDGDANVVMLPFGGEPRLYRHEMPGTMVPVPAAEPGPRALRDELVRRATAVLQTASVLFDRGAYNVPGYLDKKP